MRYRLKEKLQTIPGVGEIQVGGVERNVRLWLDASKMGCAPGDGRDVLAALTREHIEIPAGRLETSGVK